eukprot:NODE_547_length_6851_cov_0.322867.p1 type:complete len:421 gc:universal NODE_547_length_6851_cov_0.322867:5329-6591(+)
MSVQLTVPHLSTDQLVSVSRQRWVQLTLFSLFNFSNASLWISYASVATISAEYYSVSTSDINWLSLVFMVVFLPFGALSMILLNRNLKYSILLGVLLNFLGAWIRYIAGKNYFVALFGQILAAIAQTFALNCTTKLSSTWFPQKERTLANAIMSLSNPVGIAFTMVLIPSIVSTPDDVPFALLMLSAIASLSLVSMVFLKSRPLVPPSRTAIANNIDFMGSLTTAFTNKNFVILAFAFGLQVGLFNAVTTDIQLILDPYGYTPDDAGYCSAGFVISGLLFAGIMAPIVDKTGKHVLIMKVFLVLLGLLYMAFTLSLHPNVFTLILIINIGLGAMTFALLPIALELGVEITYPELPEASSNNILWTVGQIFGIVVLLALDAFREAGNLLTGMWMISSIAILSSATFLFFNGTTRRRIIEEA